MAKISVAMTTYGGAAYVEQQLISLRDQRRAPDEVIILDDRSKDDTARIVSAFIADNRLNWHFEVNEENLGFIRNFRRAISMTTGDVVFLCDQDDVWHDDKIETMAALFEGDAQVTAVNASFRFIDGEGQPMDVPEKPGTANHGLIFRPVEEGALEPISEEEIVKSNISPGCTMAFSAAVRAYYLEHATDLLPHDWELNIYAARLGKVMFLNKALISYRIHEHNTLGMGKGESKELHFHVVEEERLRELEKQEQQAAFLRQYDTEDAAVRRYIHAFDTYVTVRADCLRRHRFWRWGALVRYSPPVCPPVPLRKNVGDLIYALRLQKLFGG